jgi:hypothetical protein
MLARRKRSSVVLLVLLFVGVAVVGALTAGSGRDMVHRDIVGPKPFPVVVYAPVHLEMDGVTRYTMLPVKAVTTGLYPTEPEPPPLAWLLWTSLPGASVLLTLLVLMAGIVLSARRRGRYAPRTLRLLWVAGLVGLLGGLAAAGVEAFADRWTTPPTYGYSPTVEPWQLAVFLGLLGCALLAVREVLAQAGEMQAELETVI